MQIPTTSTDPFPESLVDLQAITSLVMPIRSAWTKSSTGTGADAVPDLSESEFPFLEGKPEVDRKTSKGRRHAGEQLLMKRLAGQGFVMKTVLDTGALGKRRRARLLSETVGDDMDASIHYSINRKNRWQLGSAVEMIKNKIDTDNVAFSAIDSVYGFDGQRVMAQHQLNQNGLVQSKHCKSHRGSQNGGEASGKGLEVRYLMSKPHPVAKLMTGNAFNKSKPAVRSKKRAQMDISVYSTDGEPTEVEEQPKQLPEEVINLYRPRQQTYTLADFIQDKSAPVIVRHRPENVNSEETFEQVEMPVSNISSSTTDYSTKVEHGNRFEIKLDADHVGIGKQIHWLQQAAVIAEREEFNFQWLNLARTAFQVDISPILMEHSYSPVIVLSFSYNQKEKMINVIFNASKECEIHRFHLEMGSMPYQKRVRLDTYLNLVLQNTRIHVLGVEPPRHGMNSTQFSTRTQPLTDYQLMSSTESLDKHITALVEGSTQESEVEEEDDFEHVDIDDLAFSDDENSEAIDEHENIDPTWIDESLDEQVAELKTVCHECGEDRTTEVITSGSCGHSFCFKCINRLVRPPIACKQAPLMCPAANCDKEYPMSLLPSVFPIPLIYLALRGRAEYMAKKHDLRMFECPTGCGTALIKREIPYNQVECGRCYNHWCPECLTAPHWPMTCSQAKQWREKCLIQADKGEEAEQNHIQIQYYEMVIDCQKRRFGTENWKLLAKELRKKVGYKLERQFVDIMKTTLQMVENGFAWLYMTKGPNRPASWPKVKVALMALYSEFNRVENCVIKSPQCENEAQVAAELHALRGLIRKGLQEYNP
ncbi:unnamed protein product [Bursaphelenchus xylophilus]|uniref:(pine wood nematode) hypothetical protein n=1 Tax=Bursaphelenchus xylophilus TaxID=6326 RepID=A0A1I7RNF8_BURXY|nr:unnamed protein product [Bursaphelenchus xylophilus]CAG9123969.1 unnamed protein product [Bursaphelenchus xylophilus]